MQNITDQDIIENKVLWRAVYDHEFLARVRDVIISHEVPHPEFIIRGYLHQGRVMSVNGFPPDISEAILVDLADKARKGESWMGYETTPRKVYEVRVFWEPDEGISENPSLRDIVSIYGYRDWSGDALFSVIQKESEGASLIVVHGADLTKYDMSQGQRKNITTTLLGLSQLATRLNAAIVVDSEFPAGFLDPQHESLVDSYFRAWKHGSGFTVSFRADYADDNERLRDGRELGGEQFYAEFENGALTRKPDPLCHEFDYAKEATKDLEQGGGREIELDGGAEIEF